MRSERKQEEKKEQGNKRFATILAVIYIIATAALLVTTFMVGVVPMKYFAAIIAVLLVISFFILRSLLRKPGKPGKGKKPARESKKRAASVFAIIMILISCTGTYYMANTLDFFGKISGTEQTHEYYVTVRSESEYDSLNDISGQTVGLMDLEDEVYTEAQDRLKAKAEVDFETIGAFDALASSLIEGQTDVIFLNSAYYDLAIEEVDGFTADTTRIIDTVDVTVDVQSNAKAVNVTKEPFNVYISGLDTTGSIGNISRSDVNMVMTVNPQTKTILLTSIPRDYYVDLATKGAKDKLTHSGLYGIDETTATVEDLLGIDINYYVKVNFTTVVKLVDTLGGITVNSDYSFSAKGLDGQTYTFTTGENTLDGQAALAFSRERYSFAEGDNQRVKNQQAVITGIINKCTSSSTVLTNYNGILNSLEDNIQTNMTQSEISSLVRMQLGDMTGWTIQRCSLTGSGMMTPVYSIPNYSVYVMVPDESSISEAKTQINSVMGK